ncbi:hypothetical protein P3384_13505 [Vibrio parahaemolyticus]|nr:hypothetical protein [Vibrio parahaemolyticus]MDF4466181.1 hypothetical protein [Vibrio parahaemolyticus]MDF4471064.1 hypothetical protein [Vibrio parahaemolyticus]MDF4493036.1 hypothetical protein [Vibrio parahaemolyticus]MDG2569732.1 hypothetical protein [Vibrio parahaemolyticus]
MTEKTFWIEHGASIIAVSGSLLTAIVAHSFAWFNKRTDQKQEVNNRKAEFKRIYVIEPLMTFIKKDIVMAQAVYAKGLNNNKDLVIDCSTQGENLYIASLASSISPVLAEK